MLKDDMLSQKQEFINSMRQVGEMYGGSCTMCMATTEEIQNLKTEMMQQKDDILNTLNKMKKVRCEKCTSCTNNSSGFGGWTSNTCTTSTSSTFKQPPQVESSPATSVRGKPNVNADRKHTNSSHGKPPQKPATKRTIETKKSNSSNKRINQDSNSTNKIDKLVFNDNLSKLAKGRSSSVNTYRSDVYRSTSFTSSGIKLGGSSLAICSRSTDASPRDWSQTDKARRHDDSQWKDEKSSVKSNPCVTQLTKRTHSVDRFESTKYQRILDSLKQENKEKEDNAVHDASRATITDVSSLVDDYPMLPRKSRDISTLKFCTVNELRMDQRKLDEKLRTLKNEINDLARYTDGGSDNFIVNKGNIRRCESALVLPVHSAQSSGAPSPCSVRENGSNRRDRGSRRKRHAEKRNRKT